MKRLSKRSNPKFLKNEEMISDVSDNLLVQRERYFKVYYLASTNSIPHIFQVLTLVLYFLYYGSFQWRRQ